MNDRLKELIDFQINPRFPWSDLEQRTGISGQTWRKAYGGKQRVTEQMIDAIGKLWPNYICWFVCGSIAPEIQQSSPAMDRANGVPPAPAHSRRVSRKI